ncbi:MAG: FlgD immunoglobulin-like domain containing protein [Candidatus Gracilibacteria bacterium]
MWKKFLAVMAIVGLLSAQTAVAADPVPGGGPIELTPLISGVELSVDTFNPSAGEVMTATIGVSEDSYIMVKVINPQTGAVVTTLVPSALVKADEDKAVIFDGLSGGNPVADGQYVLSVIAGNVAHTKSEFADEYFTVSSTPAALAVDTLTAGSNGTLDLTSASKIEFTFSVNKDSTVTLVIKDAAGNTVKTLTALAGVKTGTFEWDGEDEAKESVDAGTYTAVLTATAGAETATKSANFFVKYDGVSDGDIIKNVVIDPNPWDPSDEELTIEWELAEDVKEFSLTAIDENGKKIELMEDEKMDADDYEYEWNGLDEDDDYIKEGTWVLEIKADGDVLKPSVKVKYSTVEFYDDMFVTKTSFDNTIDEFTYVVFRVEQDAVVTVEVKDGNKEVDTLMDEEEVSKNTWYAVKWDGMDDDGDEVDEGTYEFEVTAANKANEDVETPKSIEVTVEEDTVSSGKSNVVNDFIYPVVVSKNTTSDVEIQFTIDEEAEVTVEIFKGNKNSNPEIVLMNDTLLKAGDYKMVWDARDEDGKKLDKNTKYSYRVATKVEGSSNKTDKEKGFFVIGEEAKGDTPTPPTPKPPKTETCGGFWDVTSSSQYCTAIAWAKAEGIFDGYPDGSFKQYSFINRAEALKVVLEAFEVSILPDDYTNLGFKDVSIGAWYMKYLRTGKFYGMVDGYAGTTLVGPGEEINRVELLKYTLEAAETINGYKVPVCNTKYYPDATDGWYKDYVCLAHDYDLYNTYSGYFYPGNAVARGEVALLLYRLNEAGLLQ